MSLEQFAPFLIPQTLDVAEGRGGLPVVKVTNRFAEADIYLHGAHVTRFDPAGERPMIWTSPASPFADGKSIRGGVPVCFPWFGPHRTNKDFPIHGILRFRSGRLAETSRLHDGRTRVVIAFDSDEATRAYWPHDFRAEVAVTVGESLDIALSVTNTGRDPFSYEDCFHTYFAVADAAKTAVVGFDGVGYLDRGRGDVREVQRGDLKPAGETTRIYALTPPAAAVADEGNGRRFVCEQRGMANTVVWNPWEASAAKNPEILDKWKEFLCLEAANCVDSRITLLPGTSHVSGVNYRIERA